MSIITDPAKSDIISKVINSIEQHLPKELAPTVAQFARGFYETVALADLSTHSINDLYGAVVSLWNLQKRRAPHETILKIYNPNYEQQGWQATHTIMELVSDDMPFLVDTLRMEFDRLGYTIHLIVHYSGYAVQRDGDQISAFIPVKSDTDTSLTAESVIYFEIDRQTDAAELNKIEQRINRVLQDVYIAVEDWRPIRQRVKETIAEFQASTAHFEPNEMTEALDFLRWIEDHHFTFLGCRDYELVTENGHQILKPLLDTGLGVFRDIDKSAEPLNLAMLPPEAQRFAFSKHILIVSKTNTDSTIHRNVKTDYIGIKRFDSQGNVIGERRIVGLFTAAAYLTSPRHIPYLRGKVTEVMEQSGINPKSHSGKVLLNIIETLPRDDLFQASVEELLELSLGIFYIQERKQTRLFVRKDIFNRFYSCLIYLPRDRVDAQLGLAVEQILKQAFNATEISFSTNITDSVLARLHFVVRVDPSQDCIYDVREIEKSIVEVARTWQDDLAQALLESYGEEKGNALILKYPNAFPASYREAYLPIVAVYDIKHIEKLTDTNSLELNFYRPVEDVNGSLRLKVYRLDNITPLSDVLPILENMGLRTISEKPHQITLKNGQSAWINDFGMNYYGEGILDIDKVKDIFQEAFLNIWFGLVENDSFNRLVLCSSLNSREISFLRAVAKYLRQAGFTFSQSYIETTLYQHPEITASLVQLFKLSFDPDHQTDIAHKVIELENKIEKDLDLVANLDEDRILRRYLDIIRAMLRTNYFQTLPSGEYKSYISIKFDPSKIPELPLPRPLFEIFVYSPRFEGIHLRGGKVARGGLRWSDRREDFRTEVLGLMKAQQVKNSVIVPAGAKGGFIPKNLPADGTRDEILQEGIACYQNFIRGLLDITDNFLLGKIVPPERVVRYDEDDSYLVVAADKGTAAFSDFANAISLEYGFWLGDAFASGGATGYDHKKIAITARGGWESVKRHFRDLGTDINTTDFTVIGIGDMAGDVFGNGMLLSRHIKLVAAFNHMHIFIDPNPNAEKSFEERQRLFNLPRSAWSDYNSSLISEGGGVYPRNVKSITLTPQVKQLLGLDRDSVTPNELIIAILKASVDLLWNGGIGTFVKATSEHNSEVGDRTNDAIRITGTELRCKVVGEGGNLGFSQLARIEYALNGGRIFTDFIDNSGGVDCSDHEVNIKILLNHVVLNGDMTIKQRNQLLAEMQDEVASLVLRNNYRQTQAISLASSQAFRNVELHARYIGYLEQHGLINRALEFLPDEKTLLERKLTGNGLTTPAIAVLLSYSKTILKREILDSDVPEDPTMATYLERAFPKTLCESYAPQMREHGLRREIIATQLSNALVNKMGFTFIYRLADETGAPISAIVRAYIAASRIFDLGSLWSQLEALDYQIPTPLQHEMMMQLIRLIRRVTRWFLRNRRSGFDITEVVERFTPELHRLKQCLVQYLAGDDLKRYHQKLKSYMDAGVSEPLASEVALCTVLQTALDVIDAVITNHLNIDEIASVYYSLDHVLELGWIRRQVIEHVMETHWDALSREAIRDDLDWQQKKLAVSVLSFECESESLADRLKIWYENYQFLVKRWQLILTELRASPSMSYTMLFVAVRELLDLTQTSSAQLSANRSEHQKQLWASGSGKPTKSGKKSEKAV